MSITQTPNTVPAPVAATMTAVETMLPLIPRGAEEGNVRKLLRFSIAISGTRCVMTYAVVPVLSPLIEPTPGDCQGTTTPVSALALIFDGQLVRRLWATYRLRWELTVAYALLIAGILDFLAEDIVRPATDDCVCNGARLVDETSRARSDEFHTLNAPGSPIASRND
jgi:hypothetical protein